MGRFVDCNVETRMSDSNLQHALVASPQALLTNSQEADRVALTARFWWWKAPTAGIPIKHLTLRN